MNENQPLARLGSLLETMAVERRFLIGSSHFTGHQHYMIVYHSPVAVNGVNNHFVARARLTATEGLYYVKKHKQIARLHLTHAVIHLGGNGVMNRDQKLRLWNFGQAIEIVKALGVWLIDQYNVEVHYSEFLPYAHYPCLKEHNLPDCMIERKKFWLN